MFYSLRTGFPAHSSQSRRAGKPVHRLYVLQKERYKEGHKEYICDMLLALESDSTHNKKVMGVKLNDALTWISINCNNLEVLLHVTASPSEVQHFKL